MSKDDEEKRVALEQELERLGASRILASGVAAKVRVMHLDDLLAVLRLCTHAAPIVQPATKPIPVVDAAPENISLLPDIGEVIPHGASVLVTITSVEKTSTRTYHKGYCTWNGTMYSYSDSFNPENGEAKYNLRYLESELGKNLIGKKVWVEYVTKRDQLLKRVRSYKTVEHYEAIRHDQGALVFDDPGSH
jgi:hypothetical protein